MSSWLCIRHSITNNKRFLIFLMNTLTNQTRRLLKYIHTANHTKKNGRFHFTVICPRANVLLRKEVSYTRIFCQRIYACRSKSVI